MQAIECIAFSVLEKILSLVCKHGNWHMDSLFKSHLESQDKISSYHTRLKEKSSEMTKQSFMYRQMH